jgi:hypothetical protein
MSRFHLCMLSAASRLFSSLSDTLAVPTAKNGRLCDRVWARLTIRLADTLCRYPRSPLGFSPSRAGRRTVTEILRTTGERSQGCRLGRFRVALRAFDLRAARAARCRRASLVFDPLLSSPFSLSPNRSFSLLSALCRTLPRRAAPARWRATRPFVLSFVRRS